MNEFAALVFPVLAVWSSIEVMRAAPRAVANVRVRRRLVGPVPTALRGDLPGRSLPRPFAGLADGHRRRSIDRLVPERLDRIVRRLRSGSTLPTAILDVGTDDDLLGGIAADLHRGRPLTAAIARWRAVDPAPNRGLASVALELAAGAGGSSARVLDGVAESLRDRVALEREVTALSSQSRASAALLVLAPVVFALVAGSIDRRILATLLGTPIGWVCLLAGLVLDGLGALWMARLVGRHR